MLKLPIPVLSSFLQINHTRKNLFTSFTSAQQNKETANKSVQTSRFPVSSSFSNSINFLTHIPSTSFIHHVQSKFTHTYLQPPPQPAPAHLHPNLHPYLPPGTLPLLRLIIPSTSRRRLQFRARRRVHRTLHLRTLLHHRSRQRGIREAECDV